MESLSFCVFSSAVLALGCRVQMDRDRITWDAVVEWPGDGGRDDVQLKARMAVVPILLDLRRQATPLRRKGRRRSRCWSSFPGPRRATVTMSIRGNPCIG